MRRFLLSIVLSLITSIVYANNVEVIYKGPRYIGDWETIELSSIKFHDLEIGDTIYVYASKIDSTSLGAFQNHKWNSLEDAMNGDVITGDFEMIVDTETKLSEIKQFGLKVRGVNYEIEKIVIKHCVNVVRTIVTIAVIVVLAVILIAFIILLFKNRQLQKLNHELYMRNLDVLAAADHEREIRTHYEGQIEAFKEILNKNEGNTEATPRQKYQSSSLAEDNKTMLNNSIMKVFESDEIFSTDFNMQKLAALVSSNYNNVSQVINEQFGKNFSQLLNEYRIAEACRRLNDIEHYGKHTIEAIGESVGYGSRSTFITQFKLLTGMTPSDFQHQAKA